MWYTERREEKNQNTRVVGKTVHPKKETNKRNPSFKFHGHNAGATHQPAGLTKRKAQRTAMVPS